MAYKKILTIQDISCVGQCSLTVALPILSVCGHETAILPSAVLSTHTGGFKGFTFRDLSDDFPAIQNHWQTENISFDAIYTGYLGTTRQIAMVEDILRTMIDTDGKTAVDPAMGDNGKLYPGFDEEYVAAMRSLCAAADVVLPNITEACFLTGHEYSSEYDEAYVDELIKKLVDMGCKCVVLTGVGFRSGETGVLIYENGEKQYYCHEKINRSYHGTGDIYSSAFVGCWMQGKSKYEAARIAAEYTVQCIKNTIDDEQHWYGVKFETAFPKLIKDLKL